MLTSIRLVLATTVLSFASGFGAATANAASIDISQKPLFTTTSQPPLNMLVMGKDTKNYYEAYNDASDLNGDGALDIGYKPATITYYGYFNSDVCYTWDAGKVEFIPSEAASNKQCSGKWSGDFLNYLTTSRMDALRRVLYGGWRQTDSTTETVLQGAFFPQDGHSWGKEYQSVARDGYDISKYSPLAAPAAGTYHLFAVTTVTGNDNAYPAYQAPLFRVLKNTDKRVWNWLSIEGPVAGNKCFTASNTRTDCVTSANSTWDLLPDSMYQNLTITTWKTTDHGNPASKTAMDTFFTTNATSANKCGTGAVTQIHTTGQDNNPFTGNSHNSCGQDYYLTKISGQITVPTAGNYTFGIDGDDAVDLIIDGTNVLGWYGGHGAVTTGSDSHSVTVSLAAGSHNITFRQQEAAGGDNWGLYLKTTVPAATRDDYYVRVQSCPSGSSDTALRESSCKKYPNGQYKPTGILHDYGENSRMFFGLITGSQPNNLEGGVLRRNMSNFADEIDANTGQFKTTVNGIANSISSLRMIGGGYNDGTTDNLTTDKNWNWNNNKGDCPTPDISAPLSNGDCRMWGNPLAEMLYESLRYFAGAGVATKRFASGGNADGTAEETTMGLHTETWKDPYKSKDDGGGGFLECAKPYQTIISDINPSYDGDLPGSAFNSTAAVNDTPSTISGFDASAQGQIIWNSEFGGSRNVFIGDVGGVTDGAPTAKTASSFGNIRGLSPEEPTKGGTYYSASVARYARVTDINAVSGLQNLSTYAIALASPLPRMVFPVGNGKITLVPFAKTASGTFGKGPRKPTNTIVDFYVEKIVNLPNQPVDLTVNGGRAYAVFRINYEDSEQGNDHDMDAIVRYLIQADAAGTVTVTLKSEYAAGSADQNMGYVMSGTTQDGVYLDVRDSDSGTGSFVPYVLNTPNPDLPGACNPIPTDPADLCNKQLPLTSTRTFTPVAADASSAAIFLNDPLWYAAKYGAPNLTNDDVNGDGVPDNYFLVTNPATLRTQLDKAFTDIIANSQPTASVATSTPRFVNGATLAYEATFNATDWSGDLKAYKIRSDGVYAGSTPIWKASDKLPAASSRNIFTSTPQTSAFTGLGVAFTKTGLSTAMQTQLMTGLDTSIFNIDDVLAYLRGDQSKEVGQTPPGPYRKRSSRIGDVLNSSPAVGAVTSYGYGQLLKDVDSTAASAYAAFVTGKKSVYGANSENPVVFFGSNDGMLHAIDGSEGTNGGKELFAYVPNAAVATMNQLVAPSYTHRYYVDGSPTLTDAYLGGWKTVLAASTGAGLRGVFALDVTNPKTFSASKVLWELNSGSADTDAALLGQDIGRPWVGFADDGNWVATFGNGYNSTGDTAVLFIRKLADGTKDATIKIPVPTACATTPTADGCGPNGLGMAVLVDNDNSGAGDTIYAGDYLGNLWRFDYDGTTWALGNSGSPLFVAKDANGKRQSITSGIYTVANPLGGTMVIFGTGRYLSTNDADSSQIGVGTRPSYDTIYGVLDSRTCTTADATTHKCSAWSTSVAIAGRADLEAQAITGYTALASDGTGGEMTATRNGVNYKTGGGTQMGWYLDLKYKASTASDAVDLLAGTRVIVRPDGILTDVVVNTIRPQGDSCEPGVQNATMVLDALTGAADYIPVVPAGGWPDGYTPPTGQLGTDTYRGPPQGEPPILIIRPPNPGVPCLPTGLPGDTCDPTPFDPTAPKSCSWRSPNSTGHPPGKPMPCGRISWRQLR